MHAAARALLRIAIATAVALVGLFSLTIVVVRQPTLGKGSRAVALAADPARLRAHVRRLSEDLAPRDVDHPANLQAAANYIAGELRQSTPAVTRQEYVIRHQRFENVVAAL